MKPDNLIGEGAFGKVYVGINKKDKKEYAIKLLIANDDYYKN